MKNNTHIDIPLLFFFFAFIIIILGLFSKFAWQKNDGRLISTANQSISPIQQKTSVEAINYALPIICDYRTKESSIAAIIDSSNQVVVSILQSGTTQKYIVQGDCMYAWMGGGAMGTKKCGVGNYVALGKQLLSSGLGSVGSLSNIVQKSGGAVQTLDFEAIFKTCKNTGVVSKDMFTLPRGVVFK